MTDLTHLVLKHVDIYEHVKKDFQQSNSLTRENFAGKTIFRREIDWSEACKESLKLRQRWGGNEAAAILRLQLQLETILYEQARRESITW